MEIMGRCPFKGRPFFVGGALLGVSLFGVPLFIMGGGGGQ